jgi:predicted CXXCH cytochrome family protein
MRSSDSSSAISNLAFRISDLMFHARLLVPVLLLLTAGHAAGSQLERPQGPVDPAGCVTAECHSNIKSHRVVHGPVNVNACDACHKAVDPAQHTFELVRDETQLCTFCHQLDLPETGVIHKPLTEGQCLQCHDPHGGRDNQFLRGISMAQMCESCHQPVVGEKRMVHGPVAADACGACHQAHAAPFPKLLTTEGRDLCLACHVEMKTQMTRVAFTHEPVEKECTQCHDPHASDFTMQIRQAPQELCTGCHEEVKKQAIDAPHQHSVVVENEACLNCHTSHGSDLARLMKANPAELCMSCHSQDISVTDGRTVAGVESILDPGTIKHGPVRDGNCGGCHNVHGSEVSRLLTKEYPATFYQAFSVERYELCFSCHDQQLVELPQTRGLTGFRNGERNLHFLHVNKDPRGRNCRACHNTHASNNELHLAESVPFGQWEMPINFSRTETGGSCAPGCHKPYDYDREQPASYQ